MIETGCIDRARTIGECLLEIERRQSDRPFLLLIQDNTTVRTFTYRECLDQARRWAATFEARSVPAGGRVVIILQHSLDLYGALFGALLRGAVPAMFAFPSVKFDEDEYFRTFRSLVDSADPSLVVVYPELRGKVERALANLPRQRDVCTPDDVVDELGGSLAAGDPDQIAFLQYSSGTTGTKKGVAITHRAALWQIQRYSEAIALNEHDVIASWLPLYHDMGLVACCLLPFLTGTPLLAMSPHRWVRSPGLLLHFISVYRATLCWLPNFAYNFLARNMTARELESIDLSSLRAMINCSEPVMAASHRSFVDRFAASGFRSTALATCYAMAETTFAVTSGGIHEGVVEDLVDGDALGRGRALPVTADHPQAIRLVSSGRVLPETTVTIVSEGGQPLPDRSIGEIVVGTPALFGGYLGRREATERVLQDGVFHTGDLGYVTDGEVFVTGRKKDLIIVAGRNLSPHDIEGAVNDIPGVVPGRSVAFGVPDEEHGTEQLIVIAETSLGPEHHKAVQREIVARVVAQTHVVPADVRLVPPRWLKKSTSGKIARGGNRQQYLAQAAQPDAASLANVTVTEGRG